MQFSLVGVGVGVNWPWGCAASQKIIAPQLAGFVSFPVPVPVPVRHPSRSYHILDDKYLPLQARAGSFLSSFITKLYIAEKLRPRYLGLGTTIHLLKLNQSINVQIKGHFIPCGGRGGLRTGWPWPWGCVRMHMLLPPWMDG